MKKILVITVAAIMATPANALTMCAANWLDAWRNAPTILQHTVSAHTLHGTHGTWAVASPTGGTGMQSVTGIAQCTTLAASWMDTRTGNFTQADAPSAGGPNCWCRVISPIVGRFWVYFGNLGTGAPVGCAGNCAQHCISVFEADPHFRDLLLRVP